MGANGSLGTVNLKDHSFDKIKDLILSAVGHAYDSLYEDHWEDLFYKVCEANDIQELSWLFQSKVVGFVEPSAGIEIEGQLICDWAKASVPCVVRDHGGDWRSKSLAPPFIFSTTLDGFYFANCVLAVRASPLLEVQI